MVWACIEKRRIVRRQYRYGDGGAGERRIGRPERRWLVNINKYLSERELPGEEEQDRVQWRRIIRNIDHTYK